VINQNDQNDITDTIYPSTINLYTILYQGASLNRPFGFTDKFDFEAGFSFGTKAVENDNSTTTQDLNINDVSDIFELKIKIRNQIALSKRLKLFDEFRVESFRNGQVFINERYRIGGLNSLRGFNENYFFIESFITNRLELRQYFESRSFFYLFHDIMFAKSNATQILPFGFGVGFSLQTKTGLLNFALALGKEQKRPIAPSESKVHIGFISKF
jgi:hemolysin activation/secretion protein